MKHLIGLLFCIGFLLFAGTTETQAQTAPTFVSTYQVSCLDIGKPKLSIGTPTIHKGFIEASTLENVHASMPFYSLKRGFAVDIVKLREASRLAAFKTNEALFYRYRYVPACPVQYVSKGYGKYYYYSHLHYIQSPKWQSNFNI